MTKSQESMSTGNTRNIRKQEIMMCPLMVGGRLMTSEDLCPHRLAISSSDRRHLLIHAIELALLFLLPLLPLTSLLMTWIRQEGRSQSQANLTSVREGL